MYILSPIVWFVLTMFIYLGYVRQETRDSMDRFFSGIVVAIFVGIIVAIVDRRVRYHLSGKKYPYFL